MAHVTTKNCPKTREPKQSAARAHPDMARHERRAAIRPVSPGKSRSGPCYVYREKKSRFTSCRSPTANDGPDRTEQVRSSLAEQAPRQS
jgi:hypothetical protein